jgi:hypothetical protein
VTAEEVDRQVRRMVAAWMRELDPTGTAPTFGSPAWLALPPSDRRRTAAVVRNAEAYRRFCSREQVERDLLEELQREDASVRRRVREASWQVSAALDWANVVQQPTHAELEARRRAS